MRVPLINKGILIFFHLFLRVEIKLYPKKIIGGNNVSYTKHEFKPGNRLFASQLNEMDDQIKKGADLCGEEVQKIYLVKDLDLAPIEHYQMGVMRVPAGVDMNSIPTGKTFMVDFLGETYVLEEFTYADSGKSLRVMHLSFTTPGGTVARNGSLELIKGYFQIGEAYTDDMSQWAGVKVSIYYYDETIHTIPDKYMSKVIIYWDMAKDEYSCSLSYNEVLKLVKNGVPSFYFKSFDGVGGCSIVSMNDVIYYEDLGGIQLTSFDIAITYKKDGTILRNN
jgi:hypothetical protein